MARFAEVVVNTPLAWSSTEEEGGAPGGTLYYSVPPYLGSRLRPGHLVRVPLRTREVHAIVVALHDESPVRETRPVLDWIYPEPVLSPLQIQLARWIAETYLTPWIYALRLFLPPRMMAKSEPILARVPEAPVPKDLTPEEQLLLARLSKGPVPEKAFRQGRRSLVPPQVIQSLIARGLIRRYHGIAQPPLQPRQETFVQLLADEATARHVLLQLGRSRQDVDVLLFLAQHPDPLPTVETVMESTGCTPRALRRLTSQGLVTVEGPTVKVVLTLPISEAERRALEIERRAPAQARALRALVRAHGMASREALHAAGVSRAPLNALAGRGWVRLIREPATVRLNLPLEEVFEYALRAKGLETHARVLEALADADGPVWVGWLYAETGADRKVLRDLERVGLIALSREERIRDPLADKNLPPVPETPPPLTAAQAQAWAAIRKALDEPREPGTRPRVFLLHGVTGSGKTEVYLRAIAKTLEHGRQVLYLVPEIALTPQTIQRVAARFPGKVAVWHSDLTPGERYDTWRRVKAGDVDIIVGTRSALFAPVSRLGLIVMDEEHDESYKNQRLPYYHARDVALELARLTGSVVILGSATPDIVTYTRAQEGAYQHLQLPRRVLAHRRHLEAMARDLHPSRRPRRWQPVADAPEARAIPLPPVRVVDMRLELKAGNRSIFSRALQKAMREALTAGEQVILFMNRRGQASFVLCRDCGHVLRCDRCDVPLAFHLPEGGQGTDPGYLLCHHCNRRYPHPDVCPACGGKHIRYFGGGTQRVAQEVQRLFPEARVLRWDRDVTLERGAHWRILNAFARHAADVLIGTQMLAKGLDLPRVTLVGVISADEGLFLPDYRAAERTFQVLTQVAGRAGRGVWGGRVIVQTYHPDHYAVRAAAHHDYDRFYRQEMAFRQEMGYPPAGRLVRLLYTHTRAERAQHEARRLAQDLRLYLMAEGFDDVTLIGPAPCFYPRLRGQYRWHILLGGPDPVAALRGFRLPPGWRADVDPVSTL